MNGRGGPPNIAGMTSLKVDNLTYRTKMDDLEHHFKKYGEIGDIYIPRDQNTKESRGFAFVRFYKERDADDAMDGMDGKVIDGREIRVALAKYGRPTNQYNPQRDRGGRDRGGGYRDRRGSPPRRRRSRSRSRSRSPKRRARSPSRSPPRFHQRSASKSKSPRRLSNSPGRSPSKSPIARRSPSRSRSRSVSRN